MGYNGFPLGCSDDEYPWAREGEPLDTKYVYVTHSELNAILNYRGGNLEGAKIYVSLFPCNECAKAIIQSGIKEIIYVKINMRIRLRHRFKADAGFRRSPATENTK